MKALSIAAVLFVSAALAPAQDARDPKAVEIAHALMETMGGQEAWNNMRYIRFDFKVGSEGAWRADRTHLWDKWEGRYRYEDGKGQVVLFNTNTREGQVYQGGQPVEGEDRTKALEGAYGAYINDTYWLAMPWKWLDPGVSLSYIGEKEHNGQTCDVIELSFQNVGLTPGDRYQGFVSRDSGMMIHWEYTLQSDRTGSWDWEYMKSGGLALAATHKNAEGMEINMGVVEASGEVDEAYFTDPAKSLR